jgi:hypothetical protein
MVRLFEEEETHPSYGLVQFNRKSGGSGRLFGSSVENPTQVSLKISRGKRSTDYGKSWYFSSEDLIEVDLSPSQFSELLTSMNTGPGVPCTIRRFNGKGYTLPEETKSEVDRARDYHKTRLESFQTEINAKVEEIDKMLATKKTISKSDRAVIKDCLYNINRELHSNMPFYFDCFAESTDKVVAEAKSEIDGFVTHIVHQTGLEALKDKFPKPNIIQIESEKT